MLEFILEKKRPHSQASSAIVQEPPPNITSMESTMNSINTFWLPIVNTQSHAYAYRWHGKIHNNKNGYLFLYERNIECTIVTQCARQCTWKRLAQCTIFSYSTKRYTANWWEQIIVQYGKQYKQYWIKKQFKFMDFIVFNLCATSGEKQISFYAFPAFAEAIAGMYL